MSEDDYFKIDKLYISKYNKVAPVSIMQWDSNLNHWFPLYAVFHGEYGKKGQRETFAEYIFNPCQKIRISVDDFESAVFLCERLNKLIQLEHRLNASDKEEVR